MKVNYTIRLDDACPTMDRIKWGQIEGILDNYGVKPMVGIIPHNEDKNRCVNSYDEGFWQKVHNWEKKGWSLAIHGYNHVYATKKGLTGLNPMWQRSEFVGLSLSEQKMKIKNGVAIMKEKGFIPHYFFAPSHTFDENTLEALRTESNIRIISDTIGRFPYKYDDFYFVPQIAGHCMKIPFAGIYTFSFHPNSMNDEAFKRLELFLSEHYKQFTGFDDIDFSLYGNKKILDRFLSFCFYTLRKLRKIY